MGKNFDAVTAYDVYGQSIGKSAPRGRQWTLSGELSAGQETSNSVGVGFMPTVAPGYNDTAVRKGHPGRHDILRMSKVRKKGMFFAR
jgi:hypothetical protein